MLAAVLITAACRSRDGPTEASPVASVALSLGQPSILVGETTNIVATLLDGAGKVVDDRAPVWLSLTPSVVSVTQAGVVTGLQSGTGRVRASSGRAMAEATVSVVNPRAGSIRLARDSASLFLPGGTVQAIAAVTDLAGNPLGKPTIVWSSSAPQIAAVNVAGLVTAVASGDATIGATVDGLTATMRVVVRPIPVADAPTIAAALPATIRSGAVATITGTGFAPVPTANIVLVDGVATTVVAATPTQLTFVVPSAGFGCAPTRQAFVQVTANGLIGGSTVPLQVATRRELAPGQSVLVAGPAEMRCNELVPAAGRWVLSIYNAHRGAIVPGATGSATFAVRGISAGAASRSMAGARQLARIAPPDDAHSGGDYTRLAVHLSVMERNVAAAARAGGATLNPGGRSAAARAFDLSTTGTVSVIKIPNLDAADFCVSNVPVGFRTVYVGAHVAIVEDTTSMLNGVPTRRGQIDDLLRRIGDEFESVTWPLITANFGNPLARDAALGGPGRVVVAVSPRVGVMQRGAVRAFVASCDDFTVAERPSSNLGAFIYAAAPAGDDAGAATPDPLGEWLREMRGTLVHEAKHAAAFAERIAARLPLEELSWEEGSARVAEELYARTFYGTRQRGNTTFAASIACDLRFAEPASPCSGRPLLMLRHFGALYGYLGRSESSSMLGRPTPDDVSFYAGAWSLLRWAADYSAADEARFFRDMVASPATGVANVEARTGRRWDELLGEWSLATYLDDAAGFAPANPRLSMPSWNYPDIWRGMCSTMGPCDDPSNPVSLYLRSSPFSAQQRPFGDFAADAVSLVGGGFTILDLEGAAAAQVIEVKASGSEADAPATVMLAIVRVR